MNWDSAFESFMDYLRLERGLSANTIKSYEYDLYSFNKFLKKNKINDSPLNCRSETVKLYLFKALSTKKARSQARSVSAIKSFFNYLTFEGLIKGSPVTDIELPKLDKKLPEVLSENEVNKLIDSIDLDHDFGQRNKTIIEVLYGTGIRVSELINLKLSNIFLMNELLK